MRKIAVEQGVMMPPWSQVDFAPLALPEEQTLIKRLLQFPELVEGAARAREPHRVAYYLTELAGLFDAETFSSDCGLMKPDPEIYLRTLAALDVEPGDALFVGDGANDELAGAERVGMKPVLFVPRGEPQWPALADWPGLRITALEQVLELV